MTDFRARGTIMGPAGLTAVFGMGTGGAPPVSSPEVGGGAVRPPRPRWMRSDGHAPGESHGDDGGGWISSGGREPDRIGSDRGRLADHLGPTPAGPPIAMGRVRVGVVKRLGC